MEKSIRSAVMAMRTKKLVDGESIHSDMLSSLLKAMEECDSDTEHHIERTRLIGAELGKKIGLSDAQRSKLALLCLLHDIGKISISCYFAAIYSTDSGRLLRQMRILNI